MATLSTPSTPGGRIDVGNAVMEAGKNADTRPVKGRFAVFTKNHRAYLRAEALVERHRARVAAQQATVGELDVIQDEAVDPLASALAGDGQNRTNPFKALGAPAPSVPKSQGYGAEAVTLLALCKKVRKLKGLSKASLRAVAAAERAARAVQAALEPIAALKKAEAAALQARDALAQPWETSFAALKRACRTAEDDGAHGLFAALFQPPADAAPKRGTVRLKGKTPPPPA
jgi:hypothetical protein